MIRTLYKLIFLLLLVNISIKIYGQQSVFKRPDLFSSIENIRLFSDRKIYCVNENIFFTAEYSCVKELDTLDWSKVLYIELIRWNGAKLAQIKLELNKPGISGKIKIPGNVLSGNYYLKAYTKWMRNFSVSEYSYLPVKIINPFNTKIDEGSSDLDSIEIMTLRSNQKAIKGINCSMARSEYNTREKVDVSFLIHEKDALDSGRFYLTVAKVGAIDTSFESCKANPVSNEKNITDIEYLPEIKGITISGKIIDKSTKLPQNDILVSLSDPKNGEYFSVDHSNIYGRFVFLVPDSLRQNDFFIQAETKDSLILEIQIDNSFCDKPVKLPYIPFYLQENETELAKSIIINSQINDKYFTKDPTIITTSVEETVPFYGGNKAVYLTEKYIELPNVEEFLFEIVKEANIKYEKGNTSAINRGTTSLYGFPSLIFVDNIMFNNNEKLLKVPLNRIERIEVIDNGYMVGKMKYNGIISIYSKNKDFAGIPLNKNGFFFTFNLLSDSTTLFRYLESSNDIKIPDRRNTLYWNPDFEFSGGQKKTISFYTSDEKGNYVVYIRGKNSRDNPEIYGTCYFRVN